MKLAIIVTLGLLALFNSGCVMKQTHEATLQELDKTKSSLEMAEKTIEEQEHLIKMNKKEIAQTKNELSGLDIKKLALQEELYDAQNLLNSSLLKLEDYERQLETMRRIDAETKKRNEIYARFVQQLQKMIDGGQLTVTIENGRIVINLPENVLFASGNAVVNADGKIALANIANVLKDFTDRKFQIEGHTDSVPIKSSSFPSNWELSTARALSVLHLMIEKGVLSTNVSAAGFGEFHPRADNDTKEGRALNRRIEIIMLPNLDILSSELPKVAQ
ncbi:MAG: OmpA family protein [Sulfurimonas sp.]|nr:OmpA family protein [Sulfurimonas sp.]